MHRCTGYRSVAHAAGRFRDHLATGSDPYLKGSQKMNQIGTRVIFAFALICVAIGFPADAFAATGVAALVRDVDRPASNHVSFPCQQILASSSCSLQLGAFFTGAQNKFVTEFVSYRFVSPQGTNILEVTLTCGNDRNWLPLGTPVADPSQSNAQTLSWGGPVTLVSTIGTFCILGASTSGGSSFQVDATVNGHFEAP
jgi:hypothetical protein